MTERLNDMQYSSFFFLLQFTQQLIPEILLRIPADVLLKD